MVGRGCWCSRAGGEFELYKRNIYGERSGLQFSGNEDAFHFVYRPLSGDGSIMARVTMPYGTGAEAGVMIRESLDGASANGTTIVPSAAL